MKRFVLLLALALGVQSGVQGAEAAHHWKIKDGENSIIVADSLGKLDGKITTPDLVKWAREDDRDWFLSFSNGGKVVMPNDKSLEYQNGFIASVKFSCDMEAIGRSNFAGLLCKGRFYKDTYSIMIQKRGKVLVYLNGITPNYIMTSGKPIKSKRDNDLIVAVGNNRMTIVVNGKVECDIPVKGRLKITRDTLTLGMINAYPFSGNIYDVKIEPYSAEKFNALLKSKIGKAGKAEKKTSRQTIDFQKLDLPDPAGTVMLSDFSKWSPKPQENNSGSASNIWIDRPRAFIKPTKRTLMVPFSPAAPHLEYDPRLSGSYDCYLGLRAIAEDTAVMAAFGDDWYRIELPGVERDVPHYSAEQLVARNVKMDGKKIRLASGGTPFFVGYLKFIPSKTPRKVDYPVIEGYRVLSNVKPAAIEDVDAQNAVKINKQIADGFFRERFWQSPHPEPVPLAASRKRGFMVWSPDTMEMIFPQSRPAVDKDLPVLKTTLAAGENGDIAVAVRALTAQDDLELKIDAPLKNQQGQKAGNITITSSLVMTSVKRTTNFRGRSEFMRLPGFLAENTRANIKPLESCEFFLTVKVPYGTPGGTYRTVCTLRNRKGTSVKLPLEVLVRNYDLPKVRGVDLGFWCRSLMDMDGMVAKLAEYGMTSSVFNTLAFKGSTAEDLRWDFDKMQIAKAAAAFKKYGLTGRMHILPIQLFRRTESMPIKDRKSVYVRMIRELEAHFKANNWPSVVYHSFDEVLSVPDKLGAFKLENQYLTAAGVTIGADHIWYKTSRPYQKEVDELAPMIKVFVNRCNNRNLWYVDDFPTMVKSARKLGKEVMAYNSHNAITATQPSAMRFCMGWFFRTVGKGASGQLFWTWSHYANNPANDLDGTDTVYIIPPYGKQPGGPTLELVFMREGITDLRYIQLLESEIAAAKKRGVDTSEAEKLLRSLANSFDMDEFRKKSVFFNSFWEKAWEKDGKRYASGDYLLPVGWKLADYSNARKQIADAIEQLKNK